MNNIEISFTLSAEAQQEVDKVIAEGRKKYAKIAHIVFESDFDAGPFFEEDFEDCIET